MNYFELYPGDYLRDTMRLGLAEHGAFVKLLFAYYAEEEALPADFDELFTIAGAVKTTDKVAVKKVAEKYFPIAEDGLRHNSRADEEIAKASTRMESKGTKKSSEAERQQRYRDRRKAMFEALAKAGIVPDFNISMDDLTDLVTQNVTSPTVTDVTPSRALHTATRPQTPDPNYLVGSTEAGSDVATGPSLAGQACLLMRQVGVAYTNPQHASLIDALRAGITPQQLAAVGAEAIRGNKAKPFAWAIETAMNRLSSGEPIISENTHAASTRSGGSSAVDRVRANVEAAERRDREHEADNDGSVVSVIG